MTKEQFAKKFRAFCKKHDVELGCTSIYSKEEWNDRGEIYGLGADFTIASEDEFLSRIEYSSNWDFQTNFHEFLESIGYWYEQGYHWSFHLYPL